MIMKYFNEKGDSLTNETNLDNNSEDFCTILDQIFKSAMK